MKFRGFQPAMHRMEEARAPVIDDEPKSQGEAPFWKVQIRSFTGEERPANVMQLFSVLGSTGRRLALYEDETTVWDSSAQ